MYPGPNVEDESGGIVFGDARIGHRASRSGGEGKSLNKQELKALIETANTPEEHQRIVEYLTRQATQLEAKSRDHETRAASYKAYARSGGVPNKGAATPQAGEQPNTVRTWQDSFIGLRKGNVQSRRISGDR